MSFFTQRTQRNFLGLNQTPRMLAQNLCPLHTLNGFNQIKVFSAFSASLRQKLLQLSVHQAASASRRSIMPSAWLR